MESTLTQSTSRHREAASASAARTMTAAQAAARLGIQRASLYAYVSRGTLLRTVAADGKTSQFDAAEVEALARRKRGRPPLGTVDVMLSTGLTRISDDGVWYRDRPLADIAGAWSFERTAEWLWSGVDVGEPSWQPLKGRIPPVRNGAATRAALQVLAGATIEDSDLTAYARSVVPVFAGPEPGSVAIRLARRFNHEHLHELIDVILVLLADHELASSTLAARIAASTRASGTGVLAAGIATLSGPLHGGATRMSMQLFADVAAKGDAGAVIDHRLAAGERLPGFGHAVYRTIDPRARLLFTALRRSALPPERLAIADAIVAAASTRVGVHPNIDLALAAFGHAGGLDADAVEWLFLIARCAGWIAHANEEYGERPLRFRPRSVYVRSVS